MKKLLLTLATVLSLCALGQQENWCGTDQKINSEINLTYLNHDLFEKCKSIPCTANTANATSPWP